MGLSLGPLPSTPPLPRPLPHPQLTLHHCRSKQTQNLDLVHSLLNSGLILPESDLNDVSGVLHFLINTPTNRRSRALRHLNDNNHMNELWVCMHVDEAITSMQDCDDGECRKAWVHACRTRPKFAKLLGSEGNKAARVLERAIEADRVNASPPRNLGDVVYRLVKSRLRRLAFSRRQFFLYVTAKLRGFVLVRDKHTMEQRTERQLLPVLISEICDVACRVVVPNNLCAGVEVVARGWLCGCQGGCIP